MNENNSPKTPTNPKPRINLNPHRLRTFGHIK
jgi:hypothetical protein